MILEKKMQQQGNKLFRYRSYIPLIFLAAGMLTYAYYVWKGYHLLDGYPFYETLYNYFCLFISLLGLFVRAFTVGYTPDNTSGRNTKAGQIAQELNVTGMYSITRNPLYFGNFLMWLGIALITCSIWFVVSFCFVFWVYYERIIFAEEQFLKQKFGDIYIQWSEKTPCFFPKYFQWKKPFYPFNWKKVIRQEKNSLTALFLVFFSFHIIQHLIDKIPFDFDFIAIATIGSLILYFILKYLKYYTKLLYTMM